MKNISGYLAGVKSLINKKHKILREVVSEMFDNGWQIDAKRINNIHISERDQIEAYTWGIAYNTYYLIHDKTGISIELGIHEVIIRDSETFRELSEVKIHSLDDIKIYRDRLVIGRVEINLR